MKKNFLLILALSTLTLACQPSVSQDKPYQTISIKPVDETKAIPELNSFVKQLIAASERRDTAFVLSLVEDDAVVSHGGGLYGKEAFLEEFIQYGNGFDKLKQVLRLGGTVETDDEGNQVFSFPYVQSYKLFESKVDTIEIDPSLTAVGLDSAVTIYNKGNDTSIKKVTLSYPMLKLDPDSGYSNSNWIKVSTFDNKFSGFVKKDKVYYAADITLHIQRIGEGFKIVSVAPYD